MLRNNNGVIRVPFLIKGKIIAPPEMDKAKIEAAFADAEKEVTYRKIPEAQLIREPVIDRVSLKYTGEYIYQVLPLIDFRDLIETDIDKLVRVPTPCPSRIFWTIWNLSPLFWSY